MIQIDDTLVSLDLIEANFICDLAQCKGICCVEGDSGAPLEKSEIAKLEKALPLTTKIVYLPVMTATVLVNVLSRKLIVKGNCPFTSRYPAISTLSV